MRPPDREPPPPRDVTTTKRRGRDVTLGDGSSTAARSSRTAAAVCAARLHGAVARCSRSPAPSVCASAARRLPTRLRRRRNLRDEPDPALHDERLLPPGAVAARAAPRREAHRPLDDLHPDRRHLHAVLSDRSSATPGASRCSPFVWTLAGLGVLLKSVLARRARAGSASALYLGLGWIGIIAAWPVVTNLPAWGVAMLAAGGMLYTVGRARVRTPLARSQSTLFGYHEVFHVFVVAGSAIHFSLIAFVVL